MKLSYFLVPLLFMVLGCNSPDRDQGDQQEKGRQTTAVVIPEFNADSSYAFVKAQLDYGPRVPNTPAHDKCAAYLTRKLESYAPKVIVQKGSIQAYNDTPLSFQNIIASWKPETNNRILLCAHWDSRPYADHDPDPKNHRKAIDGANDGASGVGVLLEIARQLNKSQPAIGIDIILFDVEDYGPPQDMQNIAGSDNQWGLGSQYWARNPHKPQYFAKYGILLDMVGASGATFLMEGISMKYAPEIVKSVWTKASNAGYSAYFLFEQGGYITDDHIPINTILNIPTIDIIHLDKNSETGFHPYWHTLKDNLEVIDKTTLKVVGQTLLKVIYEEE